MTRFGVFSISTNIPASAKPKRWRETMAFDLAISNPCFELWLLLHFQDNPGMQDPRQDQRNADEARAGIRQARRLCDVFGGIRAGGNTS